MRPRPDKRLPDYCYAIRPQGFGRTAVRPFNDRDSTHRREVQLLRRRWLDMHLRKLGDCLTVQTGAVTENRAEESIILVSWEPLTMRTFVLRYI